MYSMMKKILSIAIPFIRSELKLTKGQLGLLSTYFAFSYGTSKLLFNFLIDFIPLQLTYASGLLVVSILLVLVSFVEGLDLLLICWFLSGLAHGMGASSVGKLVVMNFDKMKRGTIWSIITCVREFKTYKHVKNVTKIHAGW